MFFYIFLFVIINLFYIYELILGIGEDDMKAIILLFFVIISCISSQDMNVIRKMTIDQEKIKSALHDLIQKMERVEQTLIKQNRHDEAQRIKNALEQIKERFSSDNDEVPLEQEVQNLINLFKPKNNDIQVRKAFEQSLQVEKKIETIKDILLDREPPKEWQKNLEELQELDNESQKIIEEQRKLLEEMREIEEQQKQD